VWLPEVPGRLVILAVPVGFPGLLRVLDPPA